VDSELGVSLVELMSFKSIITTNIAADEVVDRKVEGTVVKTY